MLLITVSLLLNVIFIYVIFNLYRKNEILEKITNNQSDWIGFVSEEFSNVYTRLKVVDNKNLFDRDDDVGFVFSEILKLIKITEDKINNYETEIQEDKANIEVKK